MVALLSGISGWAYSDVAAPAIVKIWGSISSGVWSPVHTIAGEETSGGGKRKLIIVAVPACASTIVAWVDEDSFGYGFT
jgi:hypothetical protein